MSYSIPQNRIRQEASPVSVDTRRFGAALPVSGPAFV